MKFCKVIAPGGVGGDEPSLFAHFLLILLFILVFKSFLAASALLNGLQVVAITVL